MIRLMMGLIVAASVSLSWAQAAEISVTKPSAIKLIGGTGSYVFLEGEILPDTPRQLEAILVAKGVDQYSTIFFNSPGGSLLASLEIGRIIRKYGLSSSVGSPGDDTIFARPGACYSACAYAYIGGQFRFMGANSTFGVHRFSFKSQFQAAADAAQITSAILLDYLREMDVDPAFFEVTTRAGGDDIYEPTTTELKKMNVVNDGYTRTVWTLEASEYGLYLKGQRDTVYGLNKFIVMCEKNNVVLYVIFDPQGRQEEVMRLPAHTLVLNGEYFVLNPVSKTIHNDLVNLFFNLPEDLVQRLSKADSVGMMVQPSADAPLFLGFDRMPFQEGRTKLSGLLNTCRA